MKKSFLLTIMLFFVAFAFGQDAVEATEQVVLEPSFDALKQFFLPAITASALILFADAKKYMFSGQWDWVIFLSTKLKPFLIVNVGAILLYYILLFVPYTKPFIEILAGFEFVEITAGSLIGAVTALVDGLAKPKVEPIVENVEEV